MTKDSEVVTTTMRLELEIYMWIRDHVYHVGKSQQGRTSINQTINQLLSEAIKAREQATADNII
jgi:hypothetical protein